MRSAILVLAVALVTGNVQARADMVTYYMTGTVKYADFGWIPSADPPPPPVSVGDHITWTLQYDRSLTGVSQPQYSTTTYTTSAPTFSNIVDQTNSNFFSTVTPVTSTLTLQNDLWNPKRSFFRLSTTTGNNSAIGYSTDLELDYNGTFPTSKLSNLQLNTLPSNFSSTSYFDYSWGDMIESIFFETSVDSISVSVHGAPEPGSLALCLLGLAGLAASGMRRRLQLVV